jgi:hypothetical protein
MTARGPTSVASKCLIGVLLILVASAILPGTTARAEDCLSAPNSPAREGTQWRYRLDWATQRKCWYMRAIDPSTHQTTAHPEAAPPAPVLAIPIPSAGPPATGSAISVNRTNPTPPSSNREEIDTKTTAAPPLGGPTPDTIPKEFASQRVGTPLAAPAANTALGTATDETTSAIPGMHQAAPATAVAPDAETPTAAPQAASSSELNAQVAASGIRIISQMGSGGPPGRESGAATDERIDDAGRWVPPLYFIAAFLLALVVQLFMPAPAAKTA